MREGYVELAFLYNKQNRWLESINYLIKALCIKQKPLLYINEKNRTRRCGSQRLNQ